ncbi:bifunctional DNA primase/polymerase [Actinomadura opuntiae]|uniref:bifunctional DNA primase/polymerase n=1 Tax=Actinomadura sp. OS1-43 TaxID=604315 RepID=UPI00255AE779|nr:bifunctional DNA primase/polymerase [Actinomadura sp. OS1-43]MDL4815985.1 bifunctional DNA primase/polymerase [Actinomadura sp. OS1-43]
MLTIAQSGNPIAEPLKFTLIPFQNVEATEPAPEYGPGVRVGTGKWSKKPSVYGAFTEYPYGSVTTIETPSVRVIHYPTERGVEAVQVGVICSPESGLAVIDVDDPEAYAESDLGELLPLEEYAYTRRGAGGHIYLDMRHVPKDRWPTQGPIQGGDIKSAGFVAAAGSLHYSGDRYERTGKPVLVANEQELEALLEVKRESTGSARPGAYRGDGHGDDDLMARSTYGWVFSGLDENETRERWQELADEIQDPSWPFREHDFQRHYRPCVRKYERHMVEEQARLKKEQEAEERARELSARRLRGLARAREVREQCQRDAEQRQEFMVNLGKTPLRETPDTCVPHPDHEGRMTLLTGHGRIVTETWKAAKIHRYQTTMWSFDWRQRDDERLLALDILAKLSSDEDVHGSAPWLADRQDTLDVLLKDHPTLLGRTTDGYIVALEDDGEEEDYAWRCTECRNVHRLKHWPNLPPEIVLAQGCPLATGVDVANDRKGQKRLVALYVRLRQEREDAAKAGGRPLNPTKDRATGKAMVNAWNGGERGEYACLSINKVNRILRKLAYEKVLLIRLRKSRNYLRKHRCRTASPVYGPPSERPELTSPDDHVREDGERRLQIEDDLEWNRFWMRREQAQTEVHELRRQAVAA